MQLIKSYIRTILLIAIIAFLSLMNVNKVVPHEISFFPHFDKFAHFCMYFALSYVFLLENHSHKFHIRNRWIVLDTILIGIILEILQFSLTKSRSGDIYDAVFNFVGVCVGTGFFLLTRAREFFYKLLFLKYPYSK